jgi:hypothetical protein
MPRVGFKPTIPVFQRANTVHSLDCAATVIGKQCHIPYKNYGFLGVWLRKIWEKCALFYLKNGHRHFFLMFCYYITDKRCRDWNITATLMFIAVRTFTHTQAQNTKHITFELGKHICRNILHQHLFRRSSSTSRPQHRSTYFDCCLSYSRISASASSSTHL